MSLRVALLPGWARTSSTTVETLVTFLGVAGVRRFGRCGRGRRFGRHALHGTAVLATFLAVVAVAVSTTLVHAEEVVCARLLWASAFNWRRECIRPAAE